MRVRWTVIFVLYGITALVALITGFLLWKKHSRFPDTRVGYHVAQAMQSEAAWNFCNRAAGKCCLAGGVVLFVLLPFVLWLQRLEFGAVLGIYFAAFAGFCLVVLFLPLWLLRRKGPQG